MTFEFDGQKYRQASAHQQEWGQRIIEEFTFQGNEHILDLGCGDGGLTARLAALVPDGMVVGLDAATGMIDAARERYQRSNLQFVLADINCLEADSQFDVVFSNATLHWIKDHGRLLAAVYRALRPAGLARFNFAGDGNCAHFFRVVRAVMARPEYTGAFTDFEWPWYMPGVEEYTHLVAAAGFTEHKVWAENADRSFPSPEAMIKWIDQPSLVPFLPRLAEPDRPPFRDLVVERMREETQRPDGTCFETFRRINVRAKK
jgi:trans-aconitate methyltransferase